MFRPPVKLVTSSQHMTAFKQSTAFAEMAAFILALNAAVRGKARHPLPGSLWPPSLSSLSASNTVSKGEGEWEREGCTLSAPVQALIKFLAQARQWVDEVPPIQQAMRFGNRAFRTWHAKLMTSLPDLLRELLDTQSSAAEEIAAYLDESFGNQQRIDYGTGHELNFVLFMCCLHKLHVFVEGDQASLVLDVFAAYLALMEHVQLTYWLEPAGSKGSWGLDDYQFLVFLWGSSQLIGHESELVPSSVLDLKAIQPYESQFLYCQAIAFIYKVKTGPFHEHSALLYSISNVPTWSKVNSGLNRMYEEEVLSKFPIVQHIRFGSLLPFIPYVTSSPPDSASTTDDNKQNVTASISKASS